MGILKKMEEMIGEKPEPRALFSKLVPQWIARQADERKFVMSLPNIPEKYKHLIMIAVATLESESCTEVFVKIAKRSDFTDRDWIGNLSGEIWQSLNDFCHSNPSFEMVCLR